MSVRPLSGSFGGIPLAPNGFCGGQKAGNARPVAHTLAQLRKGLRLRKVANLVQQKA